MKKSEIDVIINEMRCTEDRMPNKEFIITDETIICKISELTNINLLDCMGRSLLMYAAIYRRVPVVDYLLQNGAEVRIADNNLFTALHFAVQSNCAAVVNLLLAAGADANAQNCFGNSPIMVGDNLTPICIFEELMIHGADPCIKNNYGMSAVDVYGGRQEIINIFNKKTTL